jgi:DNA-binding Lrp family transcriptional regulator
MMDAIDRAIVLATQDGLPLVARPYEEVALRVGISEADIIARMQRMQSEGVIRRIGAVPNHYALGYRFNGMTVWNVPDGKASELGRAVGALPFVSHCYLRPRHLPDWPYNLFAMVHGRDKETALAHAAAIAELLGADCQGHQVLFSSRLLKKTGLRIAG